MSPSYERHYLGPPNIKTDNRFCNNYRINENPVSYYCWWPLPKQKLYLTKWNRPGRLYSRLYLRETITQTELTSIETKGNVYCCCYLPFFPPSFLSTGWASERYWRTLGERLMMGCVEQIESFLSLQIFFSAITPLCLLISIH